MAPLTIGDVHAPSGTDSAAAWGRFARQLRQAKALGADALSTDLWWGLVEAQEGHYDWAYYDKLVAYIENAGLKWMPILSFHQLGGNVGDEGYIPPPAWVWTKYLGRLGLHDPDAFKYKSEQGNVSGEYVSAWATRWVIEDYRRFMIEFQRHFANKRHLLSEINVSLGPAGELRYPSYNPHDKDSGYPTRGALQAYSELARESFREAMRAKYREVTALNTAWGTDLQDFKQAEPPDPSILGEFFAQGRQYSTYGRDFFAWYNQSLVDHGALVLATADEVFNGPQAAFRGVERGGKLPGVHWRIATDRLAELTAGLIRIAGGDWNTARNAHGYAQILELFRKPGRVLHFTALEMNDARDGRDVGSRAKTLVYWIGDYARRRRIRLKGENALAEELQSPKACTNMRAALNEAGYAGITLLRLETLLANENAVACLRTLAHAACERDLFRSTPLYSF
jgi:hypothetical protein